MNNLLCPNCSENNPNNFYKSKKKLSGYSTLCKKCTIASVLKYQKDNKDAVNLKNKKWRLANRDKDIARKKDYYKRHSVEINKKNKLYKELHVDNLRKKTKAWKESHKEKRRQYKYTRRARERNSGIITDREIKYLFEFYKYTCLSCGVRTDKISLDHIIPLSKGGDNLITNAQPLCLRCNDVKGINKIDYRTDQQIKDFSDFLQQGGAVG